MQLREKSLKGFLWVLFDQVGSQILAFVISVVLARILAPDDFGLIAMTTLFINIGNSLMDSGLTSSLIRSKEINQIDYDTVFTINIMSSFVIYGVLYFAAPFLAGFYDTPLLESVLKVYTLTFIINAFFAVQKAILVKDMKFKYQMRISLPSLVLSGIAGVIFAMNGFGVWSLVYMYLLKTSLDCCLYWCFIRWRPTFNFSYSLAKYHMKYGINIAASSLIHVIYTDLYNLFIGKIYNSAILGYYYRANSTKNLVVNNLSTTLDKVLFPVFATIQDNNDKLKSVYRQVMQQVFFWICPILSYFLVMAHPIFILVFSEKWAAAVPYFQILCLVGILTPIQRYNVNVLKVKGRSDLILRLEYIKKPIFIVGIFITMHYGVMALMWNQVFANLIGLFINSYYSGVMINYNLFSQFKDLLKTIINTLVMSAICFFVYYYYGDILSPIMILLLTSIVCMAIYFLLSFISKNEPYFELKKIFNKIIKSRK